MATFERRRNAQNQITAVRVKIRRVGLPHLSKTFHVIGSSLSALKATEKQAQNWVDEVAIKFGANNADLKLANNRKEEFNSLGKVLLSSPNNPNEDVLIGSLAMQRLLSGIAGDRLIKFAGSSNGKILTALLLETGMSIDEATNLRWQQIHLNSNYIDVVGISGLVTRQVPLTPLLTDVLLSSRQRKYGQVFTRGYADMASGLPMEFINIFGSPSDKAFTAKIRIETAHRMADRKINIELICLYLGISSIVELGEMETVKQPKAHQTIN
jgi:hypothetical protein